MGAVPWARAASEKETWGPVVIQTERGEGACAACPKREPVRGLSRGPELPARKKRGARSSSRQREGRERALPVQNARQAARH